MDAKLKVLFSNTGALLAIQIAGYLLPLLLIPYLTRVLGVSLYGVVAFGLAIVHLCSVITDFGFNLSATYQIAKSCEDQHEVKRINSAVMICKFVLLIPVAIALSLFLLLQGKYDGYNNFFLLLLLPIIGQAFQPIWLFQGLEKMTLITLYMIFLRLVYLVLVLALVSGPADLHWIAISYGATNILAAAIGITLMFRVGYNLVWPGVKFTGSVFKDSVEFFWSRAAVAAYTVGGTIFLGLVSTPVQVAYFSAAEQLYKGAQSLFQPVSQALYPYMAKTRDLNLFVKILKGVVLLSMLGVALGIGIGEWVISIIFGGGFSKTYPILIIFLAIFLVAAPSILLGYPFLGAMGDNRSANLSVLWAGAIQILLFLYMYTFFVEIGALSVAISIFLVELFVLSYRALKVKRLVKYEKF